MSGRIETLTYVPVVHVPEDLEDGKLYVSERFQTAVHRCCCGCGEEVVTPIHPTEWRLQVAENQVTLRPSIGNWNIACRSHYWIKAGRVVWAREMSREEIARSRKRDRREREAYYARQRSWPNRLRRWLSRLFRGNPERKNHLYSLVFEKRKRWE